MVQIGPSNPERTRSIARIKPRDSLVSKLDGTTGTGRDTNARTNLYENVKAVSSPTNGAGLTLCRETLEDSHTDKQRVIIRQIIRISTRHEPHLDARTTE